MSCHEMGRASFWILESSRVSICFSDLFVSCAEDAVQESVEIGVERSSGIVDRTGYSWLIARV